MQLINAVVASAVVFSGFAAAQSNFSVATPSSLVQCQPYQITWTGGAAPFFPRITQPGAGGAIIENFPQTSSQSYTWTVDQAVGKSVTIVIGDSTGATAASAQTPEVAAGSSSSCLNSSSSAGASSTSGSSSTAAGSSSGASTTAASSASDGSSSTARSTGGSSSAPASSSTSTPADGASTIRGFSAVVAGAVGVVVAALL